MAQALRLNFGFLKSVCPTVTLKLVPTCAAADKQASIYRVYLYRIKVIQLVVKSKSHESISVT